MRSEKARNMEEKKKFWVRVPFAGVLNVEVRAEEIESGGQAFDLAMVAIDKSGFTLHEEHNEGHEHTCTMDEWSYLPRIVTGNVLHTPFNEVEWESADD